MTDPNDWKPTTSGQERARAHLARIDQQHVTRPVCALEGCGQRVNELDKHGLCSKESVPHQEARGKR